MRWKMGNWVRAECRCFGDDVDNYTYRPRWLRVGIFERNK